MSRYVVIEVDDLGTAERLRAQIDKASEAGRGMRIAGLFISPTAWCGCPKSESYHKNEIVRGAKLGWWVHRVCRRARPGTHNLTNQVQLTDLTHAAKTGRVYLIQSLNVSEIPNQNLK